MIKKLSFKIEGLNEIRLNNPQAADPLNKYAQAMKKFTSVHSSRRDEEHYKLQRELEVKTKLYWDDELGVYIPTNWVMEAIAKESFAQVKVAKAKMRSAVFMSNTKLKLIYKGMDTVSTRDDLVYREDFKEAQLIKQGQVKIVKVFPQFSGWSFNVDLDFDDSVFTEEDLKAILKVAVNYNGFGDFRPTYGRGTIENWECV